MRNVGGIGKRARFSGSKCFGGHRLVAAQKARISALKAAGLATKGHERLLEIMERRLRLLEEDERKLRPAHERAADVSAKL